MTCQLVAVRFAAKQPLRLAQFWSELLAWDCHCVDTLLPTDDTGFRVRFFAVDEPRAELNHAHFDLTSVSSEDQQGTVSRALTLGAQHVDVGQTPAEGQVVLADPEGNPFCVIEPGNAFLAECGFVGALSCEGSRDVGYFWSAALGWPLVWDQDDETAIRSPHGGPKLTWGGTLPKPRTGVHRAGVDLAPVAGGDQQAEIDRLLSLGATHVHQDVGNAYVELADPDGSRFRVLRDA